jgi:prepilin-type N-terminal cleavage/methylation domain-containing protein
MQRKDSYSKAYFCASETKNRAFSLVELSIVLVILGLLVGGVIAGKHLIKAAQIRSEMNHIEQYRLGLLAFQDKYMALPGDLTNATSYWAGQTTDGDGDGQIEAQTPEAFSFVCANNCWYDGERPEFFRQLSLAGLVNTSFDGSSVLGLGYPASIINPSGGMFVSGKWEMASFGNEAFANSSDVINANLYMAVIVSRPSLFNTAPSACNDSEGIFTPKEVWAMDKKWDDGNPASGKLFAHSYFVSVPCTSGAEYNVIVDDKKVCNMMYELLR